MTCIHVLDLIDAGPFADYPPAHLDAAWQHARECAACGRALEAASTLTADLAALSSPAPPPDMAAIVLARIARLEPRTPGSDGAASRASETSDWPEWATALGGAAAGLALVLTGSPAKVAHVPVGVRGITAGLVAVPSASVGSLVLAASLVVYAVGLFVSLHRRTRR